MGRAQIMSVITDEKGHFEMMGDFGPEHKLLINCDIPTTPGADYMPVWLNASRFTDEDLVVTLRPAASLIVEGDLLFVEINELPVAIVFSILDPASGKVQDIDGVPLIYGTTQEVVSFFLGLEPNNLIVPVGEPFEIGVNSTILIRYERETRSFEIDEPITMSNSGDRMTIDSKPYSVRYNQKVTADLLGELEEELNEMESFGFYLVREKRSRDIAGGWLSDSAFYYEEGRYVESFDSCKRAYIELAQTKVHLDWMLNDAAASVYIIIGFLALTSTTIAFLLFQRDLTKVLFSIAFYAFFLIILYLSYPGSETVPILRYLGTGVLALSASLGLALVFPSFMRGRGFRGRVPLRNIVVPIFSIAKRSIRRRRLRFLLTMASITVLVMSFVSLTSLSESYGLIVSRVSRSGTPSEGILVRAPSEVSSEISFLTPKEVSSGWIERQPEVHTVSYKAENLPFIEPIARLNGMPVNGVIGFDPEKESMIFDFNAILREGELPSEGGIVVSEALRGSIGAQVGDTLALDGRRVVLEGIIDDGRLLRLADLDGSPYLPSKLVNADPMGDLPDYKVELCEPEEVVIATLSDALEIPLVRISRFDLVVEEDVDIDGFSRRLALERGYWVWSATEEGIYFSRLGNYLVSKGFPLIVPWAIVVLNVVVTMYNSLYEGRKEIQILSSVGLNPAQIAAIFVAEAIIIGFIAGGLGYLSGMILYKGMHFLNLELEIEQKVSAFWSMASIGISMFTIVMGAVAALKSSVVITPSLQRRWKIEDETTGAFGPYEITIPIRLLPEEFESFVEFILRSLRELEHNTTKKTSGIKVKEGGEVGEVTIDFIYKAARSSVGDLYTTNTFIVERPSEGEYVVRLVSSGSKRFSHEAGTLMRMIIMRWSTSRGKIAPRENS